jgi:hypothetical protein
MEALAETLPDSHGTSTALTLVEQAQDLDRADVMRMVAGPALTEFMRPLYDPQISRVEANSLSEPAKTTDLPRFAMDVIGVLDRRLTKQERDDPKGFRQIEALSKAKRRRLFFNLTASTIIHEGLVSGVVIPLQTAVQIHSIETDNIPSEEERDNWRFDYDYLESSVPFDNAALREVLGQPSFSKILQRLTKGPNGYLGSVSTDSGCILDPALYAFRHPQRGYALPYWDAYAVDNGKVVGFNQTFHIAAHNRRQITQKGLNESSGCPVRHSFKDPDTGETQEPLIDTSTKFLIAALKAVSTSQATTYISKAKEI